MSVISPTVTVTIHAIPVPALTLAVDKAEGYPGDTFNFSGTFTQDATPVAGQTVTLIRNGVAVGSAVTDSAGNFTIPWIADVEGVFTFHMEAEVPERPPIVSEFIGVTVGVVPAIPELAVYAGIAVAVVDVALIAYYLITQATLKT